MPLSQAATDGHEAVVKVLLPRIGIDSNFEDLKANEAYF